MKASNKLILKTFERYLKIQSYAESTVYMSVNYVKDFLIWSEKQDYKKLDKIPINKYLHYLQNRKHKRKPGALSQNAIIGNVNSLKRFAKYLQITGKQSFEINFKLEKPEVQEREILTKQEIKELYNACENTAVTELAEVYGLRNRAILSIYYGCGLRRSEGISLNVNNILLSDNMIFVQKGKGYKQRYVPMNKQVKEDLRNYILHGRDYFLKTPEAALFIGRTGKRLTGSAICESFKRLQNKTLINKKIGLHTLRHSIATHLLQSGMSLENVSKFLGHSSLESTQIYTKVKF
jgi:integrase/recombinase XerD